MYSLVHVLYYNRPPSFISSSSCTRCLCKEYIFINFPYYLFLYGHYTSNTFFTQNISQTGSFSSTTAALFDLRAIQTFFNILFQIHILRSVFLSSFFFSIYKKTKKIRIHVNLFFITVKILWLLVTLNNVIIDDDSPMQFADIF